MSRADVPQANVVEVETCNLTSDRDVSGTGMGEFPSPARWRLIAERSRLSDRESSICLGLLRDQKELAIAMDLGISVHTVHTHIERLYRKLNVNSRIALAVKLLAEHDACLVEQSCVRDCPHRIRSS